MNNILFLFLAILISSNAIHAEETFIKNEFIVKMKSGSISTASLNLMGLTEASSKIALDVLSKPLKVYKFDFKNSGNTSHERLLTLLKSNPNIEYVEPNYIYKLFDDTEPAPAPAPPPEPQVKDPAIKPIQFPSNGVTDPFVEKPHPAWWGLSQIGALKVWKQFSEGSSKIKVAVIDTGVDYNHPDLSANIWRNPGETGIDMEGRDKSTNGIDDDGNGYIDDVVGYDFANDDPLPFDNVSHGTHVAGIIGEVGDNGKWGSGVNKHVSIMALRIVDKSGKISLSSAIKAIEYAVKNGAKVINLSWGGYQSSKSMKEILESARASGVLVVCAAGNDNVSNNDHPAYPASYKVDNVISVASTSLVLDRKAENVILEAKSSFSNFGDKAVHIAAPGEFIGSTIPDNKLQLMDGTSMAAPFVTGAAALFLSINPNATYAVVREALLKSSDKLVSIRGKVRHGRLNIYNAVTGFYPDPYSHLQWSEGKPVEPLHGSKITVPAGYDDSITTKKWVIRSEGARFIRLHFKNFEIPSYSAYPKKFLKFPFYEVLKIYDQHNNLIDVLSGRFYEPHWSLPVQGDTVTLVLETSKIYDELPEKIKKYLKQTRRGFLIDQYSTAY